MRVANNSRTSVFLNQIGISSHDNIEIELTFVAIDAITNNTAFVDGHVVVRAVFCVE